MGSGCVSNNADTPCATPVAPTACGPDNLGVPCQESHCLTVETSLYGAALSTGAPFTTPGCGQTAIVFIPGLTLAHLGSYLWSSIYGYYEIVAFNAGTQELTIQNNCTDGNSPGGVSVPACSTFVVSAAPFPVSSEIVYLAADFVTPAIGFCTNITVTSTDEFLAGYTISIAEGEYTISAILTPTSMTICNTGSGQTPGTTIIALNGTGGYNYPIVIQTNSSILEDETVQNVVAFDAGNSPITITATVAYTNPSTTKSAQIFFGASVYYNGVATAAPGIASYNMELFKDTTGLDVSVNSQDDSTEVDGVISKEMDFFGVETVAPGATKTIIAKGVLTWVADGAADIAISEFVARLDAIVTF